MYHLVYISHTSRPLYEDDLLEILSNSRLQNKKNEITGMLLYLNEKFIQVLEGEYDAVMEVYEKIKEDPRHQKISVLLEGNTANRVFKDWSMGFKKLSDKQFEELSGFKDLDEFFSAQPVTDETPAVMLFLSLFYNKNINDYPE